VRCTALNLTHMCWPARAVCAAKAASDRRECRPWWMPLLRKPARPSVSASKASRRNSKLTLCGQLSFVCFFSILHLEILLSSVLQVEESRAKQSREEGEGKERERESERTRIERVEEQKRQSGHNKNRGTPGE
jgi:hypothetical protein